MESPFINTVSVETEESDTGSWNSPPIRQPFIEEAETNTFDSSNDPEPDTEGFLVNWQSFLTEVKVGDVVFKKAGVEIENSEEYKEPVLSYNALLVIDKTNQGSKISANFTVREFARSELTGEKSWAYARIDPDLVANVQKLRSFLKKPVSIIDGYYSPGYLRKFLKLSSSQTSDTYLRNPHIRGRGVKMSVSDIQSNIHELAIAALVSCDENIRIGIGASTMTLDVKPEIKTGAGALPENAQRITSYILNNESNKQNAINFCISFKNLISEPAYSDYGKEMHRATADLLGNIITKYYIKNFGVDWSSELGTIISLMYKNAPSEQVILYALAYSTYGCLARFYLRNINSLDKFVDRTKILMVHPQEWSNMNQPGSLFYLEKQPDKRPFLQAMRDRYFFKFNEYPRHKIEADTYFDWRGNKSEKVFYDQMLGIIRSVFKANGYSNTLVPPKSPQGGTNRNLTLSEPSPDRPVADLTGKYQTLHAQDKIGVAGANLILNQSGSYVSGKLCWVLNSAIENYTLLDKKVRDLRDTVVGFFCKMDANGVATGYLYPQRTVRIAKRGGGGQLQLLIIDNSSANPVIIYQGIFELSRQVSSISSRMMGALADNSGSLKLLLPLAWSHPLTKNIKDFIGSIAAKEASIEKALTNFYSEDETQPSIRKSKLSAYFDSLFAASDINYGLGRNTYLPVMYQPVFEYYLVQYFSKKARWRPASDKEYGSKLYWIRRMMEDYRDAYGTLQNQAFCERYGVEPVKPQVLYRYKIEIKLSSIGVGPFSRSSGTATITNNTDYSKYPSATKWNSATTTKSFPIVLWSAQLSLSPGKWVPKIGMSAGLEGEVESSIGYYETDFSDAFVQVTEAAVSELPLAISLGNGNKGGTKVGFLTGKIILVKGKGKGKLEFSESSLLDMPDSIDISHDDDTSVSIFDLLPSITMYTGEIKSQTTNVEVVAVPMPETFSSRYELTDLAYFKHDDAALTAGGIEAVGRLCSEELAAFSDRDSKLEIYGHTDASGDSSYNLALSAARAANVMQAIEDRLGTKMQIKAVKVSGLGERDANKLFGEFTQKNAWLRKVVIIINGNVVLSLGEL
ncbi:OmpA family protein [Dyadobacter sp. LHD-138]|uniref:OmpA family protein n=1 Tax=Dyadobacter sp. LHD-138 TaxID=3071413 RepID=UPI0027E0BA59|nr:OmpA family protein [Dyadobacter sp. LHD-138]MDQ6477266.1 OmpA family protein [Dyadobacter sp. LHD-138]